MSSLGIQVHGGMGYIEETGAAQLYRDARIAQIYEGTNGIQAIDLVTRKLPLSGGAAVRAYLAELWRTVAEVEASNDPAFGATGTALRAAVDAFGKTTEWLLERIEREPQTALAGATPYLRLFATAAGGCLLAQDALAAKRAGNPRARDRDGAVLCDQPRHRGARSRHHRDRGRGRACGLDADAIG